MTVDASGCSSGLAKWALAQEMERGMRLPDVEAAPASEQALALLARRAAELFCNTSFGSI
jgi:hypothetical protein